MNLNSFRIERQRVYRPEELAHDMDGCKVTTWDGEYAAELLAKYFPVERNVKLDFNLIDFEVKA